MFLFLSFFSFAQVKQKVLSLIKWHLVVVVNHNSIVNQTEVQYNIVSFLRKIKFKLPVKSYCACSVKQHVIFFS